MLWVGMQQVEKASIGWNYHPSLMSVYNAQNETELGGFQRFKKMIGNIEQASLLRLSRHDDSKNVFMVQLSSTLY
jgi:hypothetical protein